MEVYGDTTLVQDIHSILKNKDQLHFQINQRRGIHKGSSNTIWWMRFPIKNETQKLQEFILQIRNPDLHQLQMYLVKKDTIETSMMTGDHLPFMQRPVEYRQFLFPFEMAAQDSTMCYLMVNKRNHTMVMNMELWKQQSFIETENDVNLIIGILLGLMVVYLGIILTLSTILPLRMVVYYFFLSFFLILLMLSKEGFAFQYFFSKLPISNEVYDITRGMISVFQFLFVLLFCKEFYSNDKAYNLSLKIIKWGIRFIILLIPVCYFLLIYFQHYDYISWVSPFLLQFQIVLFCVLLIVIIRMAFHRYFKNKELEDLIIGIIGTIYFLLLWVMILNLLGYINSGPNFNNVLASFFLVELTLVSALLFTKVWGSVSQKEHLELINSEQELKLANALLEGQEKERFRIAHDLQKELQPLLNQSDIIFQEKYNNDKDLALGQNIIDHLRQSKEEVNRISNDLIPEFLYENDLLEAIQILCVKVEEASGFTIRFDKNNITHTFHSTQKINIYRIIQELLNNVIKHANATHVQIELKQIDFQLIILVEDNGVGIQNEYQGFNTLKARTESMNGSIVFNNSEKSGLKVKIEILLKH